MFIEYDQLVLLYIDDFILQQLVLLDLAKKNALDFRHQTIFFYNAMMQALSESLSVEEVCREVSTCVWIQLYHLPEYKKTEHPWVAGIRGVLDKVYTVPQHVVQCLLYNWMVEANKRMDDPSTQANQFFNRFPDIMSQFGRLLNVSFLDHKTISTCLLNVPCDDTRQAYPDNYFRDNPSLEILSYDSEGRKVRNYLITVGLYSPTATIGPMRVCMENVTMNDDLISCTPMKKLHYNQRFPDNKVVSYNAYKVYHNEVRCIPTMSKEKKREHAEMQHLSVCDMAAMIVKCQKTVNISVKELVNRN